MKKRLLCIVLALVLCLGLTPAPALAADSGFTVADGILTEYKGPGGAVAIPNGITAIGRSAFENCTNVTSVDIPDSVTNIGISAFSGCTGLTSVTIPNRVTEIEWYAFSGCTGLTNANIPDSVTKIGVGAFSGCTGLTGVSIGSGVSSIGDEAFMDCASLHRVRIPDSVAEIGNFAFAGCTGLTGVTIGNGVTEIRWSAFSNCTGLTSVVIPDGVTSIDLSTFNGCTGLTSVTIPNSVAEIKWYAFSGCTSLCDVYYGGGEAQWSAIKFEQDDDPLLSATIHYNSMGPAAPTKDVAHASAQTVTVDGRPVEFQMYALKDASGNDTNYIKLRDMAYVLNGTKAQFSVGYDQQSGTITAATGGAYKKEGTEMTDTFGGADKEYVKTTLTIQLDGKPVQLEAITLTDDAGGGYNYCKVRDLGQLLNFNVTWNGRVVVESDKPYTG